MTRGAAQPGRSGSRVTQALRPLTGGDTDPAVRVTPSSYREVCRYVTLHHRHHKPPRGGKVFIALRSGDGELLGVAVLGRPSARAFDPARVAEITRTCTDGAHNANSRLYGACRQIARAMGYERVVTYYGGERERGEPPRGGFRQGGGPRAAEELGRQQPSTQTPARSRGTRWRTPLPVGSGLCGQRRAKL
jgi:hypothetical protein